MLWIATFIALCAFFAAWSVISDRRYMRERKLKRIKRRLAQKEQGRDAE